MLPPSIRYILSRSLFTLTLLVAMVAWIASAPAVNAQGAKQNQTAAATPATTHAHASAMTDGPVFRDYKGVCIGMSAEEARQKLGNPQEKSDTQDFFVFSDKEMAQVFYEKEKVIAVSVNYVDASGAPECKNVLGTTAEAKPDGSVHKLVRYPKAGYWVSYSRTAGDSPLVTVTMQKIPAATP